MNVFIHMCVRVRTISHQPRRGIENERTLLLIESIKMYFNIYSKNKNVCKYAVAIIYS